MNMKKIRKTFVLAASAGLMLGASHAASDQVAYNNFGPNDEFNDGRGWILRGVDAGTYWAQGFSFEAEASGVLSEVHMPLRHSGGPNEYTIRFYEDDSGQPGDQIGEWEVEGGGGPPTPISEFDLSDGSVQIDQDRIYWMVVFPGDDTNGSWRQNDTDASSMRARDNFGVWQMFGPSNQGAFRVMVGEGDPCIADWNGDGEVDINDFFAYLSDFEAGDPRADLNNDGEIDINDFFIFLSEFEAGC